MILLTIAHPTGRFERHIFDWLDEADLYAEVNCTPQSRYMTILLEEGQNVYKAMRYAKISLAEMMLEEGLLV